MGTYLTGLVFVPILFFLCLVLWALTLHPNASKLPLRLGLVLVLPLGTLSLLERYCETSELWFIFLNLAFSLGVSCLLYLVLYKGLFQPMTKALLREYDDKILQTSLRLTTHFVAATPIIFFFGLESLRGLSDWLRMVEDYETHTPYIAESHRSYEDNIYEDYRLDLEDGIASFPVYNSSTTYLSRGEAVRRATGQIYLRIARTSIVDVVKLRVTKTEFLSFATSLIMLTLGLSLGRIDGKDQLSQMWTIGEIICILSIFQAYLLRRICLAVLSGNHRFIDSRPRRETSGTIGSESNSDSLDAGGLEMSENPLARRIVKDEDLRKQVEELTRERGEQKRAMDEQKRVNDELRKAIGELQRAIKVDN
ncbi:hypothetical protein TL16_g02678 [Triparma laevis f. inornata]|uniref:Uncharacterized protein n=1 Tax=Triparma laevis f. inornata TaxID=1714386 RepID=A0A9W7DYI5_9STRA|nr:hypothetical protein TL16_g02678 [Triparma laevis f. inornata]